MAFLNMKGNFGYIFRFELGKNGNLSVQKSLKFCVYEFLIYSILYCTFCFSKIVEMRKFTIRKRFSFWWVTISIKISSTDL